MWKQPRKITNLLVIGFLTSLTLTATYWQSSRYLQSRTKWQRIAIELSKKQPDSLAHLQSNELFALRYVQVQGSLSQRSMLISRAKDARMGYLVVRALDYLDSYNQLQTLLVVEGWIPEQFQYIPLASTGIFKGILREKQKKDYLHQKMKKQDIEKFNLKTYINVDQAISQLHLQNKKVNKDYFLQLLKEINDKNDKDCYPYQYSVDNFQLPYLTPDKHRAYAMFWGFSSLAGLGTIFKIIKMK